MNRKISLGGCNSLDLSCATTEAYPEGEIFVNLEIGLLSDILGVEHCYPRNMLLTDDEKEEIAEFFWDVLQDKEWAPILDKVIREYEKEKK